MPKNTEKIFLAMSHTFKTPAAGASTGAGGKYFFFQKGNKFVFKLAENKAIAQQLLNLEEK